MAHQIPVTAKNGQVIKFDILRQKRFRRLYISIKQHKPNPQVNVPYSVTPDMLTLFLLNNVDLVASKLSEQPEVRPFVDGGTILFKGKEVTLKRNDNLRVARYTDGCIEVPGTGARFERELLGFLQAQAYSVGAKYILRHSEALGVTCRRLFIKDSPRIWGHCKTTGEIMLNWRLICADEKYIDYVAAHEVCHLIEMNHSPAFWYHVSRVCPDYQKVESELFKVMSPILQAIGR